MNDVAEIDPEGMWAATSTEVLQHVARLAERALRVPSAAILSSDRDDPASVRCVTGRLDAQAAHEAWRADRAATSPDEATIVLAAPLLAPGGRRFGTLCAFADAPRAWTADDRDLLAHLAEDLAARMSAARPDDERSGLERSAAAELARLLDVMDRIPGLIFERRKIEGGQSRYTFFGRNKTRLPAIRQMMGDGTTGALRFVHRDDRAAVSAALIRSTIEETDLDLTFRIKDFDHGTRWVRSQSIVRKGQDGSVAWDGMCFDISDFMAPAALMTKHAADAALDPDATGDLRAPLAAISKIADFLKTESRSPLVTAHARTLQSYVEALMETLRPDETTIDRLSVVKPPACALPVGQPRVLVADDLDLNRKLIADMLRLEGYVVDCASDGAEAVTAVETRAYDLVLMDMMMPGVDGLAATRAIRAMPGSAATVPIIALTAHSTPDQLDRCLAAGMNATLTKPMSFDDLTKVVAAWLPDRIEAA